MFKKIVNTVKSLLLSLINLVKNPVRDYELSIIDDENKFQSGKQAISGSMAQVKLLQKNLDEIKVEIKPLPDAIKNSKNKDEATIYAQQLLSLRDRKKMIEESLKSTSKTIEQAQNQLKELMIVIESKKTKLETYKLRVELNKGRKSIREALSVIDINNLEKDVDSEISFDEFKIDSEEKLEEILVPTKKINRSVAVDSVLQEYGIE